MEKPFDAMAKPYLWLISGVLYEIPKQLPVFWNIRHKKTLAGFVSILKPPFKHHIPKGQLHLMVVISFGL